MINVREILDRKIYWPIHKQLGDSNFNKMLDNLVLATGHRTVVYPVFGALFDSVISSVDP